MSHLTLSPGMNSVLSTAQGNASGNICVVSRRAHGTWTKLFVSCAFYEISWSTSLLKIKLNYFSHIRVVEQINMNSTTINWMSFVENTVWYRDSNYKSETLRLLLRRTGKAYTCSKDHPVYNLFCLFNIHNCNTILNINVLIYFNKYCTSSFQSCKGLRHGTKLGRLITLINESWHHCSTVTLQF
jgi:hypothetical protein